MIRRAVMLVAVVAGTAACGDIPQPFRHEGPPASLARPKLTRGVTVRPPQGREDARPLADALVRALEDHEVPALVQTGPAFGHVIDGTSEDKGAAIVVRWSLKTPEGNEAAFHKLMVPKPLLDQANDVVLKRLMADSAAKLAAPLSDPDSVPAPAVSAPARASVQVVPLKGLPGDGDKALTAALKRALDRSGLLVKDADADYMLEGKVTVATGLPGQDVVTVAWTVKRGKGGAQLANIAQDGAVPRGKLAGPWGGLARDIAEGGVAGVLEVVAADSNAARR